MLIAVVLAMAVLLSAVPDGKITGKADVRHTGNKAYYGVRLRVVY